VKIPLVAHAPIHARWDLQIPSSFRTVISDHRGVLARGMSNPLIIATLSLIFTFHTRHVIRGTLGDKQFPSFQSEYKGTGSLSVERPAVLSS
jgi:hypothetical protein